VAIGNYVWTNGSAQYYGCATNIATNIQTCFVNLLSNAIYNDQVITSSTPCTSISASATPPSPSSVGTQITVTGNASGCPQPLYEFWALWAGTGSWILQKGYSTASTWTWNSTGAPPGTETFGVWARDASSVGIGCNTGMMGCFDTYSSPVAYSVVVQPCTGLTGNARPFSPAPSGTVIVVTATASGCPQPQYEFWALWAGTTTWILQQPYSTYPTWTWDSTGAPPGTEHFGVWARDLSTAGPYDIYISIPYTVT
jgi:hypothetical protein